MKRSKKHQNQKISSHDLLQSEEVEDTTLSRAEFLRWLNPILVALRQLGGSATPARVREQIIKNEQLSKEEITRTRGKKKVNKFANDVAFARAYLVYGDYVKNETRGVWELTEAGKTVKMTKMLANQLFREYQAQIQLSKVGEDRTELEMANPVLEDVIEPLAEEGRTEASEKIKSKERSYTKENFLDDVFMEEEDYTTLVNLLRFQKNLILQGAPGVGKTYVAKRLAYSMMGVRDESRVEMIQFHQSYAYEDFIMGFRPNKKGGFELKKGEFYRFCKRAEKNPQQDYFFIIDEINRGNLSRIFGELFLLLEKDKRGKDNQIRLMYSDEFFFIPENVYLIGTMNTADRSLAMLDYALRRRFMFFELKPAFDTVGFQKYVEKKKNPKFTVCIQKIRKLNQAIAKDESLGRGFCIGHSYFCLEEGQEVSEQWLKSVISYQITPLLEEYWFDEPEKARKWSNLLYPRGEEL